MRAALALFRFELERRWLALAFGFLFGWVTFALPLFERDMPAAELRTLASSVSSALYAVLLACVLGAALVGGDLAERRASFLFARPLNATAIAAARLAAALALVLVSAALMLLPSYLSAGGWTLDEELDATELGVLAAVVVAAAAGLLLVASAVSISVRSRSLWIVVELAALVAAGLSVERAVRGLERFHLDGAIERLGIGLALALLAALAVAYFIAVTRGRTDLARAHRAQAIALSALLLVVGAGTLAWSSDYVAPHFDEIVAQAHWAAPVGHDRFLVEGSERGRPDLLSTFLVDGANGVSVLAGRYSMREAALPLTFERNGANGFWTRLDDGWSRLERLDLTGARPQLQSTPLRFERFPSPWAVSADGRRFAGYVFRFGEPSARLEVYDLDDSRLLRATPLPPVPSAAARIVAEGDGFRLALWHEAEPLESWRVEHDGAAQRTASGADARLERFWFVDRRADQIVVREHWGWRLLDAATLATVAELRQPMLAQPNSSPSHVFARFDDGTLATLARSRSPEAAPFRGLAATARPGDRRELALFAANGELLHAEAWEIERPLRLVGIGRSHTLLLAHELSDEDDEGARGWVVERIDAGSGARRTVATDLVPLAVFLPTEPAPLLLRDDDGELFALDADTGELKPLARSL